VALESGVPDLIPAMSTIIIIGFSSWRLIKEDRVTFFMGHAGASRKFIP